MEKVWPSLPSEDLHTGWMMFLEIQLDKIVNPGLSKEQLKAAKKKERERRRRKKAKKKDQAKASAAEAEA